MNIINRFHKNKIAYIIALSFFIVLEFIAYFYVKELTQQDFAFLNEKSINDFDTHIKFTDDYLANLSLILYDTTINTPLMRDIMSKASKTTDEKKLAVLREELYSVLLKPYNYMKTKSVRQLHFHLPNAVSFLRFHRPQKFGDSLVGVRPSLEYVNENRIFVHSFEEGRVFNGFRNVYPIFKDEKFVGTVEISYSFTAMQKKMQNVEETSLLFLINSDIVSTKVFKDEKSNYEGSEFEGLSYDKNTLTDQSELTLTEIHHINKEIEEKVKEKLKSKIMFSTHFHDPLIQSDKDISIDFLPVRNLYNKQVAYIINYEISDVPKIIFNKNRKLFISLSLLIFLISISIGLMLQRAKHKENMVRDIATHDALTKIYNRYGLEEILKQRVGEFNRFKRDLSIIFLDIDHFKAVNDTYGHNAGDVILQELSQLIQENIRLSDIFARWGGEEFLLILPESTLSDAITLAEKLRYLIDNYSFSEPQHITCSFGVTDLDEGENQEEVLKRVDEFLYRAKELGRNKVVSNIEA